MTIIGSMFHADLKSAIDSGRRRGELPLRLEVDGPITATLIWDRDVARTAFIFLKVRLPNGAEQTPLGFHLFEVEDPSPTIHFGERIRGWAAIDRSVLLVALGKRGESQWDFTDGEVELS